MSNEFSGVFSRSSKQDGSEQDIVVLSGDERLFVTGAGLCSTVHIPEEFKPQLSDLEEGARLSGQWKMASNDGGLTAEPTVIALEITDPLPE